MLERILYLNDLGKCPRKSALLKLMQNKRIPKVLLRARAKGDACCLSDKLVISAAAPSFRGP